MAADSILNQPLAGARVLVLCAQAPERDRLRIVLSNAGAEVATAATPQEAFDAFQADPPHVFVGEIDENEPAPYRLIRRLRTLAVGRDVPAVALSALPWEEHRARALEAGFSQWISKPATHALVEVIAALIDRPGYGPEDDRVGATPMALLSDLAATPLAETVRRLWIERRSGDLLVRADGVARMVFFDRGRLVFAASNARRERLGEMLVEQGTISRDEYRRASRRVAQKRMRFGDALVAAELMDAGAVARAVTRWVEGLVVSLFDLGSGSASFEHRACPIPPEYRVDVPVDRLLHRGIRTMTRPEPILAALGRLDRRVALSGTPEFPVEPEDVDVLQLAKAPVTLRRLAWTRDGLTLERLRAVYALIATGVLGDPGAPDPRPPVSRETAPGTARSALDTVHRLLE